MDWIELSFAVEGAEIESLYAALDGIAPGGCSIEDPVVILGPEEGVRPDPDRPAVLRIYLPRDEHFSVRREAALIAAASLAAPVTVSERGVREEDWANAWKEFFQVERIGTHLVIRPTWRDHTPSVGDVVLDLDPGMAFGTGQHETTRMCLEALERIELNAANVLDLGCGSGILGIAALKLGAAHVTALDIESVAVEATQANAARNGVSAALRVAEGSLGDGWPFQHGSKEEFELVTANIHAAALVALAEPVFTSLKPGGRLIGSGVIGERLPVVLAALHDAGFAEPEVHSQRDWRCLVAQRPHAAI